MTWELPWIASGTPEIDLSTARVLAYAATEGRTGVIGTNDLKISATSAPSSQVVTAAGVGIASTRYSGTAYESYVARNTADVQTTVPSTGGSSRYDFIYAHITDPGEPGQPATPAPVETRVITGVPSTAVQMSDVSALAGQTGVPLARIFRGPSASIVNSSDITDIRPFLAVSNLIGEIKMWSASIPPSGYLVCDGTAISRTTYFALYGVIGTTYGSGNGTTTFNLPNLIDRTPIGLGLKSLTSIGGNEVIAVADHLHTVFPHTHLVGNGDLSGEINVGHNTTTGGGSDRVISIDNAGRHDHGNTSAAGGGTSGGIPGSIPTMNIRNPYIVLNFVIRAL